MLLLLLLWLLLLRLNDQCHCCCVSQEADCTTTVSARQAAEWAAEVRSESSHCIHELGPRRRVCMDTSQEARVNAPVLEAY
jgi:hypothetical protein